eukprot:GABV01000975.1.p2 GENE.GABV01000975.1~~GABV01000975.1.p2  ORF type:complete len:159 (+),score=33.01 GABV01000975.1:219-695(+)
MTDRDNNPLSSVDRLDQQKNFEQFFLLFFGQHAWCHPSRKLRAGITQRKFWLDRRCGYRFRQFGDVGAAGSAGVGTSAGGEEDDDETAAAAVVVVGGGEGESSTEADPTERWASFCLLSALSCSTRIVSSATRCSRSWTYCFSFSRFTRKFGLSRQTV